MVRLRSISHSQRFSTRSVGRTSHCTAVSIYCNTEKPGRLSSAPPIICGLARCMEKDIQTAYDAIKIARRPRIHTFLATSPIHREHKLRMSKEQVVERAVAMVKFAKSLCADIEFSPEDA